MRVGWATAAEEAAEAAGAGGGWEPARGPGGRGPPSSLRLTSRPASCFLSLPVSLSQDQSSQPLTPFTPWPGVGLRARLLSLVKVRKPGVEMG